MTIRLFFARFGLALLSSGIFTVDSAAIPPGGERPLKLEIDGQWIGRGVAYGPYRRGQEPGTQNLPNDGQLLEDLRLISRYWPLIRVYDSSPVTERALGLIRAHRLPLHVILGAWIKAEKTPVDHATNQAEIAAAIRLANEYATLVIAVNVGNETLVEWSGHRHTPENIIGFIRQARAAIAQPVTTADDYDFWNKAASQAVAAEVDFIMLHIYALWHGRHVQDALKWTNEIYEDIQRRHPGKLLVLSETGWATQHDASLKESWQEGGLMKGEVSVAAQETYLRQHYRWVDERKVPTLLFEAFDEPWKGGGNKVSELAAEKHWGVFDEQRRPKASFEAIIREFYPPAK
jgi:exo-beta-1,3-glucanase (GH17 family)